MTCDCSPQKSSLPVTQTRAAQEPVNTPILVSYPEPHKLKVIVCPVPTNVYQTPFAEFNVVIQVGVAASTVAAAVLPVTVLPQVIGRAPVHRSLIGGPTQVTSAI